MAPFVWRVEADLSVTAETGHFSVTAHTGRVARPQRCLLDDLGRVFIEADLGFGLVHTLDVGVAAEAVEQGLWVPQQVLASALPKLFGYVSSPQQQFLARDTSA